MRELSLNILDIAENSFKAEATEIEIVVKANTNFLTISVIDNGVGMDEEFLKRVTDPFTTSRTTRKVGMGIPLIKMQAELCEGSFDIQSTKWVGTTLTASFKTNHIDRPPLGDIAETIVSLIADLKGAELTFRYELEGEEPFVLSTKEVKEELGDTIPIDTPDVLIFIKDLIKENIKLSIGGFSL